MEPQDPQGKTIRIKLEKGQEAALIRSGDNFAIRAGSKNTEEWLRKDDTLVIEGEASKVRFDIQDGAFIPRIKVDTDVPLLVDGSFRLAKESLQTTLVDVTPVELFKMSGLDGKQTTTLKNTPPGVPEKGMNHKIQTPPLKLTEYLN